MLNNKQTPHTTGSRTSSTSSPPPPSPSSPHRFHRPESNLLYHYLQLAIAKLYAPLPHLGRLGPSLDSKPLGRVAVIGAGVTGVSSAAHLVSKGFEVVLFDKKQVTGGVWNDVNSFVLCLFFFFFLSLLEFFL